MNAPVLALSPARPACCAALCRIAQFNGDSFACVGECAHASDSDRIIAELTYRSYAANRNYGASADLLSRHSPFSESAQAFEARYQRERAEAKA